MAQIQGYNQLNNTLLYYAKLFYLQNKWHSVTVQYITCILQRCFVPPKIRNDSSQTVIDISDKSLTERANIAQEEQWFITFKAISEVRMRWRPASKLSKPMSREMNEDTVGYKVYVM